MKTRFRQLVPRTNGSTAVIFMEVLPLEGRSAAGSNEDRAMEKEQSTRIAKEKQPAFGRKKRKERSKPAPGTGARTTGDARRPSAFSDYFW
jgi:hypothetical protein